MTNLSQVSQLIVARSPGLRLFARQWGDAATADDVVQTALVSLLSQRKLPDDPVAWMYRTVRNAAIDAARAGDRRKRREQTVAMERGDWFEATIDNALDAADAETALRQLPNESREVVVLRLWGDLGFAAIAEVLGISVSTAHSRYTSALEQLKQKLEPACRPISKRD